MIKLSVIIPVYNEKNTIEALLDKVEKVLVDKEVVIVDDGSTDGTRELIQQRCRGRDRYTVILHDKNRGKGSAIRTAIAAATGDVFIIQDADLEYDPADFIHILRTFEDGSAQVVYGSRFWKVNKFIFARQWFANRFFGAKYEIRPLRHFLGIQFLTFLANALYGAGISDEATCYKAFRKEVFKKINLKCSGFEFCPEVTAKVRKAGYQIKEVPISYHPRSRWQGKKISFWKDGAQAVFCLIKYRFVD